MIPAKLIAWALDKIPSAFNKITKWGRKNEVENIDNAVDCGNEQYVNNKLRDIKKRYEGDTKASS